MQEYEHRGHKILISITRATDKVKVETDIFFPPNLDDRRDGLLLSRDTETVSTMALEDINKEAFESAKRTVDVLIAEHSAASRKR